MTKYICTVCDTIYDEEKEGVKWDDLPNDWVCPVGESATKLENFLRVSTEELKDFSRLTGNDDVHKLSVDDLCTTSSEISPQRRLITFRA